MKLCDYRVVTTSEAWECNGQLERVEATYVLRLFVTTPQAFAMEREIKAGRSIEVVAIAHGAPALAARIRKVKARGTGAFLEVACLLEGPEQ